MPARLHGRVSQHLNAGRIVTLDCNHFDPYSGAMFAPNAAAQREWFVEHLKP